MIVRNYKDRKNVILVEKRIKILVILTFIYTLLGFFLLPYLIKKKLLTLLPEAINRPVSISEIRINPYSWAISVKNFEVLESKDSKLFSFDELFVNFQLTSLIVGLWDFKEVRVVQPKLNLAIGQDGNLNIADILRSSKKSKANNEKEKKVKIKIQKVGLTSGRFSWKDRTKSQLFEKVFDSIDLSLTDLTTLHNRKGEFFFNATSIENEIV